jgi:hypothetical protein
MTQLIALTWKEWREVRIYLWIALGTFIGLPLIGGLEAHYHYGHEHFEISVSPWVMICGGVLAVFVAVGATCRDFSGRLEDFWRSRPLNIGQWLLVKYFVGLAVVLASCVLPLTVELYLDRDKHAVLYVVWYPFMWAATYSIGFLAGCLLRRTAHAAMLALAGMLLVWFLPLVLPPLQWLSMTAITGYYGYGQDYVWPTIFDVSYLQFAAGMAGIAVAVTILAMLAARRGWHIEAGRKMMYGSVSVAVLILFASAAFQLGTNLPILQQIDLPQLDTQRGDRFVMIHCVGQHGFIVTEDKSRLTEGQRRSGWNGDFKLQMFDLTSSGLSLSSTIRDCPFFTSLDREDVAWAPQRLDVQYFIRTEAEPDHIYARLLCMSSFETGTGEPPQLLWKESSPNSYDRDPSPTLYIKRDRLYVVGMQLAILDISDPLKPKLISNAPFVRGSTPFYYELPGMEQLTCVLPVIPGLSPAERLEILVKTGIGSAQCFDGQILCMTEYRGLAAYRMVTLKSDSAKFKEIWEDEPSFLEGVFGLANYYRISMGNGLVYAQSDPGHSSINASANVFDIRSNPPMRLVGHFAAPGAEVVQPLPDGRAIVGGSKLWLVGPPKGRTVDYSGGN